MSNPYWRLKDIPITLTDIIYVPKLKNNLLSVRIMMNSNVSVHFGKYMSWLILDGRILAYGLKENNLYTYVAFPISSRTETADYTSEPSRPPYGITDSCIQATISLIT